MKRRALSILLALALCLGMAIPAFAAESEQVDAITISFTSPSGDYTFTLTNVSDLISEKTSDGETWPYVILFYPGATVTVNMDMGTGFQTEEVHSYTDDDGTEYDSNYYYGEIKADTLYNLEEVYAKSTNSEGGGIMGPLFLIPYSEQYIEDSLSFGIKYESIFKYAAPEVTPVHPIAEVPSDWAQEAYAAAVEAGIVPDALMSKFTQATTRAEFCALATALYEKLVGEEIEERATFDDTDDVNVEKMAALKVVNGVGEGKFNPDAKLTREQAATMLSRLANALEKPMPEEAATFADNDKVSDWAIDAVGHVQAAEIMSGVGNNTFAPADDYTREQSIITMMRMFDYAA